jgi:protein tyrosine phosphatase (PTP) superfamily phosphohydrolase (DUF442 family)
MMSDLQNIPQFYRLSDRIYTAGQPTPEQFALVAAEGCHAVINLSARPDDVNALPMEKSVPKEADLVEGAGMKYYFIPVDWFAPKLTDLHEFLGVMDKYQNDKIFVHCALNCRVSAFLFLYQVLIQGVEEADAKRHVDPLWKAATGQTPDENEVWSGFIRNAIDEQEQSRA